MLPIVRDATIVCVVDGGMGCCETMLGGIAVPSEEARSSQALAVVKVSVDLETHLKTYLKT